MFRQVLWHHSWRERKIACRRTVRQDSRDRGKFKEFVTSECSMLLTELFMSTNNIMSTRISVIIPAYNEANFIKKTLDSILNAKEFYEKKSSKDKVEIIVVDNSSSDETASICYQYGISTIKESKRQIAACRNKGAKNAKGDIFIFLDADTIVPLKFLEIIDNNIKSHRIIGGSARLLPDNKKFIYRIIYWFWNLISYIIPSKGAVIYCEKNSYDNLNGFNEDFYAWEDVLFSLELKKLGKKYNKRFMSNYNLTVHTATRKLNSIRVNNLLKMLYKVILNPFSFYRKKEIVDCWFYTIR